MPGAPLPIHETERLAALRSYDILAGDRDESLDAICRVVASIFSAPIALVSLSDTNRQVFKGRVGLDANELARELAPCAYAILGDRPMVVEDALRDARFRDNPLVTKPPNVRFYVGAPLLTPDGFALGTLCAIDSRPQSPSAEQLTNLIDLSRTVMTTFNLRKAMSRARTFALTDPLTGLLNRSGLMLELAATIERKPHEYAPFALLYFDIDNFKYVNDTRGHAGGDDVLRAIGERLADCVRREDTPGRLGGDEFAVLLPDVDESAAAVLGQRIFERLSGLVAGRHYPIGFSVGVACFPRPPSDVAEAFSIADRLMYAAKHAGKNRVVTLTIAELSARA